MAFDKNNFAPLLASLNNNMPNIWVLTDTVAIATLDTAGYFPNYLTSQNLGIKNGDLLLYFNSSATTWNAARFVVNTSTGAVDVADFTVIGSATNTD